MDDKRMKVPQLKIEQNKDVFCLGETARLICQWDKAPVSSWKVNGTVTTTGGLNGMAGHNTSTSLTEGFVTVSITQTQPSVTSYTCIVSLDEDFPSEVVYVTFRDSQPKLPISYKRKETSLLVLLNVTSEGCPPLELVRITVNNESLIGRHNDTFRFEGLSPDIEYLLQVETQVEGGDFGLYKNITVPVYNTSDDLCLQVDEIIYDQLPVVPVAVSAAIVLAVFLVTAAVTCGVLTVLRSHHRSDRKIGTRNVMLCPDAFQHTANRQKNIPFRRLLQAIILLSLFSRVGKVCCEVPQLKIDQNKDVFCLGETARLVCTWKDPEMPALTWIVNGTSTNLEGLNQIPGHSTNTSILGGYTIVSITQTQPSTTTYVCVSSVEKAVSSETVILKYEEGTIA